MSLIVGQKAPDFALPSTKGTEFKLSNMRGKTFVLYFYPKDFTQGCTAEACEFRDQFSDFKNLNIEVIGVSRDSIATHHDFIKKHKLPFELLSDKTGNVCKKYKALVPIIGIPKRITYLIDGEGIIRLAHSDMFGAKGHISKVLAEISG